jgi:hypothetical protein
VGGTCGARGGGKRCLQDFGWEPEGKRPLGRPRYRWEDNIKIDLGRWSIDGVNWIQLAEDRVQWWVFVNMVMNLWVP